MLLVEYMYSLVVPVKVASPVAMVQVGYILRCMLLYYLHMYMSLAPVAVCHVNNAATYTSVCNLYVLALLGGRTSSHEGTHPVYAVHQC